MPHQLTAPPPSPTWRADLQSVFRHWSSFARQVPGGTVTVLAAVVLLILVVAAVRARSRASASGLLPGTSLGAVPGLGRATGGALAEAGPLALLGLGGACVSLYGLYGFARGTAMLPLPMAIGFMMIFDVAEITCFMSLYRAAGKSTKWTASMRRKRRMAWMLVGCSSAMNAAHAPDHVLAKLVLALVPVVSARLIEHELDTRMEGNAGEDSRTTPAGLVRMVQLLWLHLWARAFAALGLDPDTKDGTVPQQSRIKRAAAVVAQLERALSLDSKLSNDPNAKKRDQRKAARLVETLRSRAEAAVDAASVADDPAAMLALTRHLVTRGRVGDLAQMDKRAPLAMMTLMEELAIVPSVKALEASARAIQAEGERKAAEEARDAAEARQRQIEEEGEDRIKKTAKLLEDAENERRRAERLAAEDSAKAKAARAALQAIEIEHSEMEASREALAKEAVELADRVSRMRTDSTTTDQELASANDRLQGLRGQMSQLNDQVTTLRNQVTEAQSAVRAAHDAKRATLADIDRANAAKEQLEREALELRNRIGENQTALQNQVNALRRAAADRETAQREANEEAARAAEARRDARDAEEERRVASVALRTAHDDLLEALTNPEGAQAPQWRSEAKLLGWELYERTVRGHGREPSADELAAASGRDRTTAQHWLRDFGSELARRAAVTLPAQQAALSPTATDARRTGRTSQRELTPELV